MLLSRGIEAGTMFQLRQGEVSYTFPGFSMSLTFLFVIGGRKVKMAIPPPTPSYEKTILGSKQPVSEFMFFCRFSQRLSENNRSRVMFIAKFGPTTSDFGYEVLTILG